MSCPPSLFFFFLVFFCISALSREPCALSLHLPLAILCPPLTPSPNPQHPNSVFLASSDSVLCLICFFSCCMPSYYWKRRTAQRHRSQLCLSLCLYLGARADQLLLHSYVIAFRWMAVPLTVGGSQAVSRSFLLLNVSLGRWVKSSVTICLDVRPYSVSYRKVIVCLFGKGK